MKQNKQMNIKTIFMCLLTLTCVATIEAKRKKKRSKKKVAQIEQSTDKKKKTLSHLEYKELKKEKAKLLKKGNKEIAIKYIEKMLPLCTDLGELANLMLEVADLLFDLGRLEKAERLFAEFIHMYPGHEKVEYSSYKAILCSFWKTLDITRDQTKTKDTIEKAESFLQRKELFTTHANEVANILTSCRERLLDSEISIFNFYLKKNNFLAAQTRLSNIEKEFLDLLPEKEPVILSLACDLAEKQNNQELLAQNRATLELKFPDFVQQKTVVTQSKQRKNLNKF